MYICIEGVDGTGKTSLVAALANLRTDTVTYSFPAEPYRTQIKTTVYENWREETCVVQAGHYAHQENIFHNLLKYDIIADRGLFSFVLYQGIQHGKDLNEAGVSFDPDHFCLPNLTFILAVPKAIRKQRLGSRGEVPDHLDHFSLSTDEAFLDWDIEKLCSVVTSNQLVRYGLFDFRAFVDYNKNPLVQQNIEWYAKTNTNPVYIIEDKGILPQNEFAKVVNQIIVELTAEYMDSLEKESLNGYVNQ